MQEEEAKYLPSFSQSTVNAFSVGFAFEGEKKLASKEFHI